jgi:hypothetical protein
MPIGDNIVSEASSNYITIAEEAHKPKRPFGVWFLTIYMSLFAGIFPFGAALFLSLNQAAQTDMGLTFVDFILPLVLGIVVVVTAIGTWKGNNKARIAFLVAITIHYGFIMYQNYQIAQLASSGLLESNLEMQSWARVFRGVFWIVVCWWYFTSKRAKPFYGTPNKVTSEKISESRVCTECGEELRIKATFCHKCGAQQKDVGATL